MVDAATRLMYTQPETLSKLINQGKLFIPMALGAGVGMNSIFTEAMTMGQTGLLSGRGGAGLARYIQYMVGGATLTSHLSKARRAALLDLGSSIPPDATGSSTRLASSSWSRRCSTSRSAESRCGRLSSSATSSSAFLQQGGYYVSAVTRPEVMSQRVMNTQAMMRIAPPGQAVEMAWSQYMHTTIGAWRLFVTNFENLSTAVFLPTLPAITVALRDLANVMGGATNIIMAHPKLGLGLAIGALGSTATLATVAAASLWKFNQAILAIAATSGGAAGRIGVTSILSTWLPKLGLLAVIAGELYLLRDAWLHKDSAAVRHASRDARGRIHSIASMRWGGSLSGMSEDQLNQAYWHPLAFTKPAGAGIYNTSGGAAFENDRLRRALQQHVSAPIIQRLTGTGATSVTDSVQTSSDHTVEAIQRLETAVVGALANFGVTINVPAATGHAQTLHKLLGGHGANAGGFATHPTRSSRTGMNYKP